MSTSQDRSLSTPTSRRSASGQCLYRRVGPDGRVEIGLPINVALALQDAFGYGVGALDSYIDDGKYGEYGHNDVDLLAEVLLESDGEDEEPLVSQPQPLMLELHDPSMLPFTCAFVDLTMANQTHFNEPAFDVRLDAKVCGHQAHTSGPNHRHYRILVRPTEQPLMHDEIEQVLTIASRYELAAFHSNVGIEIRRPDDV